MAALVPDFFHTPSVQVQVPPAIIPGLACPSAGPGLTWQVPTGGGQGEEWGHVCSPPLLAGLESKVSLPLATSTCVGGVQS